VSIVALPPSPNLRDQVRQSAKNRPGTYRMIGEDGEVLYVGKSKAVRTRLLSYFRAKEGEKAYRLVREAARVEFHYEPNEFAALLRELELIKRFRPRYNVRYRRDALYSFLKLAGGSAPRLFVVRQVADDSAVYFGPFRGGRRIVDGVRELNDVMGLRDCAQTTPIHFADQAELFPVDRTPRCHRFELSLCAGPCAGGCSRQEYQRIVQLAQAFLNGEGDEPLSRLQRRMETAIQRWDFEHAAALRDRADRLQLLRDEFSMLRQALEGLTFRYVVPGADGDDRIYLVRRGTVRSDLPVPRTRGDKRRLERIADEVYGTPEPNGTMVSKRKVEEILLLSHWFRTRPAEMERTQPPLGRRRSLLPARQPKTARRGSATATGICVAPAPPPAG
jgi:excinuclease ABC subunit C